MPTEVTNRLLMLVDSPSMHPARDDIQAAIREIQRLGDEILELKTRIHYLNEELLNLD